MDSAPIEAQHHSSASKLPIKRKTPLDPNLTPLHPNESRVPPFKFHRIWTEPDEIRFLQGLLDCSSQNLAFPRDLGIFYSRFSNTMSQPYTKSQLSEKLRRLRKKFRVISTRLSKGLNQSQLSPHDRALYDLSKQLWHPDFASISPFTGSRDLGLNDNNSRSNENDGGVLKKTNLVGIKVDFSPNLPVISPIIIDQEFDDKLELECFDDENMDEDKRGDAFLGTENDDEVKLSEVDVKFEGEDVATDNIGMHCRKVGLGHVNFEREDTLGEVVVKVVLNVFDECCNDMRTMFLAGGSGEMQNMSYHSLQSRWQKQRIAELDVLGRRLRLVLEHSLQKQ